MEEYEIEVGDRFFEETIARLRKKCGEVVMVLPRPGDRVLLSTKDFYLAGTYRLPTGSIEKGETPEDALKREVREETGFRFDSGRKLGAIHWVFRNGERTVEYYSYVFVLPETTAVPVPEDHNERITGYKEVGLCSLREVGEELIGLPDRWRDWGRFRGLVHEYVHERLCAEAG